MTQPRDRASPFRTHYAPSEVAQKIGVSELLVRTAMNTGQLEALKLGKRTLIPIQAVDAWLRDLPRYSSAG